MSLFTVAGVSTRNGVVKVRFCSDLVLRVKNLQKQGDQDIQLVDLPKPMTKFDACQYLLDTGLFDKYAEQIIETQGKKELKEVLIQSKIKAVKKIAVDQEVENLKELIAA